MKRIASMILVILVLLTVTTSTKMSVYAEQDSGASQATTLSEMSETECLAFLENAGVEIPGEDNQIMDWGAFAKSVVEEVEANPNYRFVLNYTVAQKFADDIRNVVNSYCEQPDYVAYQLDNTTYTLTDSSAFTEWNDFFLTYNCPVENFLTMMLSPSSIYPVSEIAS